MILKSLLAIINDEDASRYEIECAINAYSIANAVFAIILTICLSVLISHVMTVCFNIYLVYTCADTAPEVVKMILEAINGGG